MKRTLRLATAFVIIATTLVVLPNDARACSCENPNPHEWLARADAAFVGMVIEAPEEAPHQGMSGPPEGEYIFHVDQAVKGDLPETITVYSPVDGAACGLGQGVGVSRGVFLRLVDGHWTTNSCSLIATDLLLAAAEPLPEPDGDGPIVALASVITPEGRTVALDANGNVLAYGAGRGEVNAYALCPGDRTVIEHVFDPTDHGLRYLIGVRDLRGFHVVREIDGQDVPGVISVTDIACLDPDGDEILLLAIGDDNNPHNGSIMRVRDDALRTVAELPVTSDCYSQGAFDIPNELAYFTGGPGCMTLYRYDMARDETTELVTITSAVEMDSITSMALNANGRYLALTASGPRIQTYRVLVIDLHAEPVGVVEGVYRQAHHGWHSIWLAEDRLLLTGPAKQGQGLVVTPQLETIAMIDDLPAGPGGIQGDTIYVIGFGGRVVSAPAAGGAAQEIHTFLHPDVRAFTVLPEPILYDPSARQPDNLTAVTDPRPATVPVESEHVADAGTVALLAGASLGLVFAGAVFMPMIRDRRDHARTPG